MNYTEWEKSVPDTIKADSLWKMTAYRLALFIRDIGWFDATKLLRDRRTVDVAGQLYEALGSISANLAEGYSRGTGKDRARFMNTHWVQPVKAGIGITEGAMY